MHQEFQDYVAKSLERLHQKVDMQGELIIKLSQAQFQRPSSRSMVKVEYGFPLKNMEELDTLEMKLTSRKFCDELVILYFDA